MACTIYCNCILGLLQGEVVVLSLRRWVKHMWPHYGSHLSVVSAPTSTGFPQYIRAHSRRSRITGICTGDGWAYSVCYICLHYSFIPNPWSCQTTCYAVFVAAKEALAFNASFTFWLFLSNTYWWEHVLTFRDTIFPSCNELQGEYLAVLQDSIKIMLGKGCDMLYADLFLVMSVSTIQCTVQLTSTHLCNKSGIRKNINIVAQFNTDYSWQTSDCFMVDSYLNEK